MPDFVFQPSGNSTAAALVAASLLTAGNTAGVMAQISSGTLYLAGGNNITLSQDANSVTISGAVGGGAGFTAGVSTGGNTSGDTGAVTGRLVLAGGNNVTLSGSTNAGSATVTISAANQSAESNTLGMSNLGNTSGTSGVISGAQLRLLLAGGDNITLSQSINGASATITISAAAPGGGGGSNTFGGSNNVDAGTTGVVSGTGLQVVLARGNNISLSQSINGSSATISVYQSKIEEFSPALWSNSAAGAFGGSSTTLFFPFHCPFGVDVTRFDHLLSIGTANSSANNSTRGFTVGASYSLFSNNDGTLSLRDNWSTSYTINQSSNGYTNINGVAAITMSDNMPSISHGQWFLGMAIGTSSSATNMFTLVSQLWNTLNRANAFTVRPLFSTGGTSMVVNPIGAGSFTSGGLGINSVDISAIRTMTQGTPLIRFIGMVRTQS